MAQFVTSTFLHPCLLPSLHKEIVAFSEVCCLRHSQLQLKNISAAAKIVVLAAAALPHLEQLTEKAVTPPCSHEKICWYTADVSSYVPFASNPTTAKFFWSP